MKLCKDCKHCLMATYEHRAALMGKVVDPDMADLLKSDKSALCSRNVKTAKSLVDGELVTKGKYLDCETERNPPHPFGRFCGTSGKYWESAQ